jgi:preprotein translocase subunit SecG
MYQLILVFHIFAAVCLIVLVLVQQGKGATIGAAFGGGASGTVFGSRGSGSFLLRVTIGFVLVFFATSITLNYLASRAYHGQREVILPTLSTPVKAEAAKPAVTPNSIPAAPSSAAPVQPTGSTQ